MYEYSYIQSKFLFNFNIENCKFDEVIGLKTSKFNTFYINSINIKLFEESILKNVKNNFAEKWPPYHSFRFLNES